MDARRAGPAAFPSRFGDGSRPIWTKGGDAVHFVAGSALMISRMTTQPELRAGVPRRILDDPLVGQAGAGNKPFAIAPDDRVLAIREDGSIRADHIIVVQNWLPEASRAR